MDGTILCIDDNQLLLRVYKEILEDHGYKAVLASNGWEGLEILKNRPIDCVILDYHMPGMDGPAVIRRMRRRQDSQPVILVSGSDPPPELLEQVEGFVEKSNLLPELLECIDSTIGEGGKGPSDPAFQQVAT
jgi:CheY-like chemotaxis protein